jgi:hypothetical protein
MQFETKRRYKKKEQIINDLKEKNSRYQHDILSIKKSLSAPPIKTELKQSLLLSTKNNNNIIHSNTSETNIILSHEIIHKYNHNLLQYPSLSIQTTHINAYGDINNLLTKTGIYTLINIYQPIYKNNERSTGFGDFIRGSYFLLLFCEKYNLHCKISFHNGIENLLQNHYESTLPPRILSDIPVFQNNNIINLPISPNNIILSPITNPNILNLFSEYLLSIPIIENNGLLYCTCSPFTAVEQRHKLEMQRILEPNIEMQNTIQNTLKLLGLIKKKYTCIHIRCGDDYLNNSENTEFNKLFIRRVLGYIKMMYTTNENYLLISDNLFIKKIIIQEFPFMKTIFKDIIHLSTIQSEKETEKIKNTMIEFYLLSFSKSIVSYSCYQHGSGFSYWCATTYNIPYVCKYISNPSKK